MSALVAKLVLAPAFVVGASLAARRFGPRVGGLVGGLPVVAGPILLVFALEHGAAFAAQASAGTLLGIVSLCAFIVVYARAAAMRVPWFASLLAGWATFAAMTALLDRVSVVPGVALAIVMVALALTLAALPRGVRGPTPPPLLPPAPVAAAAPPPPGRADPPAWDLPVRALSALALVLALTALAERLGPHLSGLLAPFPVIASVLSVFTHILHGEEDVARILRGFVIALSAYAMFCFTVAASLRPLGTAFGFALATAVALATQALVLTLVWRSRGRTVQATPPPQPAPARQPAG